MSLFYTYSSLVMLFFSIIKFKHAAKTVPILVYYTEIGHLSNWCQFCLLVNDIIVISFDIIDSTDTK